MKTVVLISLVIKYVIALVRKYYRLNFCCLIPTKVIFVYVVDMITADQREFCFGGVSSHPKVSRVTLNNGSR